VFSLEKPRCVHLATNLLDGSLRVGFVLATNQTNGAAMSLATKSDKRERLSAGRSRSQHSFRPASQADATSAPGIEKDGAKVDRLSFAEDFMLEHSHSSLRITFMGMAGNSAAAPREQHKVAQCYGFPS
jgi:hypothetical protein